jgi:hypothetical protein
MHQRDLLAVSALCLGTLPSLLLAQPTPAPSAAPAPSASAAPARASEEAQQRYRRALELFNEGAYDAALLEFRRAYELAPSWRILYNIGQVNVQLNDYAGALNSFERYLGDGGKEVPPERLTEVQEQIGRLKGRVATLQIESDVPGTEITIDDLPVGKAPLAQPVRVNAGRRRISANATGRLPQSRVVEVAGGDTLRVPFEMVSTEAPVSTTSALATGSAPPPPPPGPSIFWPGWIATGALGAGAAVVGVLSLGATSDYNDKRDQFGVTRGQLDDARSKSRTFSITTDVLLGAALITGGVSLYLSLRTPSAQQGKAPASSLGIGLGPGSAMLRGTF